MSKTNTNHKRFFESFFKGEESYTEVVVNGWVLIRHWDGNKNQFTVDVYSKESYDNYVRGKSKWKEFNEQKNHLKSI